MYTWFVRVSSVVSAALVLAGCGYRPDGLLRVTFLDVGQGDATVIESPTGRIALIDGGGRPGVDERREAEPGRRIVLPFLRSRGIRQVDLMVATHADEDHVQGLIAVTRRLRVGAALEPGLSAGGAMERLRALWRRRRIPMARAIAGQRIDLGGGAILEILHPGARLLTHGRSVDNDNAVVARLVYGKTRLLLTADAEGVAEEAILSGGGSVRAGVLKVGHHGSRWSSTSRFLRAVGPATAVISCGRDNRFGHPHREVLERLTAMGIRVWRTDRDGALELASDGLGLETIRAVR